MQQFFKGIVQSLHRLLIFFRKQFAMVNDSLGTGSLGIVYFCPENLLKNLKL